MSNTNGGGLPLRAALHAVKSRKRLVTRAVKAGAATSFDEELLAYEVEREEEADGDQRDAGDVGGGSAAGG